MRRHRQPPRLCEPPCSEKQAGIGPISQKPELVTMGRTYDGESDSARFDWPQWAADQLMWLARCCRSGRGKLFLAASFYFLKFPFGFSERARTAAHIKFLLSRPDCSPTRYVAGVAAPRDIPCWAAVPRSIERSEGTAGARYNRCCDAGCRQLLSINSRFVNLAAGAAQPAILNERNSAERLSMAAAPAGRAAPWWFPVNEIP